MARDSHKPGWGDWGLGFTAFHSESSSRDYLKGGDEPSHSKQEFLSFGINRIEEE